MIMMGQKRNAVNAILGPDPKDIKEEGADDGAESLKALASEVMDAVHAKDTEGLMSALKSFFLECDSEPHEEGEHTEED